jgi:16S rRNA G966 N2-methylase RsmD
MGFETSKKRNQVLELWEVHKYGVDSFSDADYLCIYGLKPADWYARGIRLLARTAVECTRDRLADRIGKDVVAAASTAATTSGCVVIDLFAGSGNTLHWVAKNVSAIRAIGFERDDDVFPVTRNNFDLIGENIDLKHEDYESGLKWLRVALDELIVVFVAPPWGDALQDDSGLDLRRTQPPVRDIIDLTANIFERNKILFAIQVYESIEPQSLAEMNGKFDWSALHIYDIDAPGKNHGILLGATGWSN